MSSPAPVPVRFADGTEAFRCGPDDTLLLAGLRAGWDMPYECASGGCGTCKVRLVDGEITTLWPGAVGMTDRDRRRGGRLLLCQSRPRSGCTIRPAAGVAALPEHVPLPSRRPARVTAVRRLTADTMLLTLDCGRPMPYLAGQFVLLELADGTRRAYSMSRAPGTAPAGSIELLVRRKPGGRASTVLFEGTAVGDRILVEGPYGRAHAQTPPDRPVVCVGGGSGLGAVLAVAGQCLAEQPGRPVTVVAGARHEDDMVLGDRIADLAARGAAVVVAVDDVRGAEPGPGAGPGGVPLRRGRAVEVLSAWRADLTDSDLYAAGPAGMIEALRATFVRSGRASADRVFVDTFLA